MHQLIRIAGPREPMRRLGEVEGLDVERASARRLADDRWQVAGYATDAALDALRERGLEVETVVDGPTLAAERDELYGKLDADRAALRTEDDPAAPSDETNPGPRAPGDEAGHDPAAPGDETGPGPGREAADDGPPGAGRG